MDNLNKTTPLLHPDIKPLPVIRCPNCESVFYDGKKCEECHFDLDKENRVGVQAYGEGSLYDLRGNYHEDTPWYFKSALLKDPERERYYMNELLARLKVILEAHQKNNSKHLRAEILETITEILSRGYPKKRLVPLLRSFDESFENFAFRYQKRTTDYFKVATDYIWRNTLLRYAIYGVSLYLFAYFVASIGQLVY